MEHDDEITDADLRGCLASVKHDHDPDAAMALVKYFHGKFSSGEPYNEQVLYEYIVHAFGLVAAGKSADIAFGFKRNNVRPTTNSLMERDMRMAACVQIHKKDNKYDDAVTLTAKKFSVGESAVRAAYTQYREAIGTLSEEEAQTLIK